MVNREQSIMQSSLKTRARVINEKHQKYLIFLKSKRLFVKILKENELMADEESCSISQSVINEIHESIHEIIGEMTPILNDMNVLHREQKSQKNKLRASYKTPLTKVGEVNGVSGSQIKKMLYLGAKRFPDATAKQITALVKSVIENYKSEPNENLNLICERSSSIQDAIKSSQTKSYKKSKYERRIKNFSDMAFIFD